MFKCQVLNRSSQLGEKMNKIVVETRPRTYTKRVLNEETNRYETVVCSTGFEIVKEINACEAGVKAWNKAQAIISE